MAKSTKQTKSKPKTDKSKDIAKDKPSPPITEATDKRKKRKTQHEEPK